MSEWIETSLGILPKDWDINSLGELLYIKGRIGWKGLKKSEYLEKGYAIINGEQIIDGKVDWKNVGRIPKERYDESPEIMLESGDILMTKDGTIGKIAFIKSLPEPATVASGVFVIREQSPHLKQKYLYYFFQSHYFNHLIKSRTEGSVIPHLYQRDFIEMEIPLPEPNEQEKISNLLTKLDNKIDLLKRQNETMEAIAHTLFKRWFVEFEFPFDFTQGRPNENGQPYKSSGGKMVPSELGDKPEGWRVGKLGEEVEISSSKRIFQSEYVESGIPFFRSKEIIELRSGSDISQELYISKDRYEEIKNMNGAPEPGDILLTSVGTIGIPYLVRKNDCFYFKDGNLTWFRKFKGNIGNQFIYYWLLSKIGQRQIKSIEIGSTQKAITIQALNNLNICIPGPKYHKLLCNVLKVLSDKIESNNRTKNTLIKTRDTLLPKLMSGKIRVI